MYQELYKNKGGKYADCKSEIFELHGDPPRCVFDIGTFLMISLLQHLLIYHVCYQTTRIAIYRD